MGFFKERKRAKELEEMYNMVVKFKKEIAEMGDKITDVQGVYDKSEELLKRMASARVIVKEDLEKTGDVLRNAWFASRDAIAYEYNIHQKRLAFLDREEPAIAAIRDKMLESGAKKAESQNVESQPGE